jgi:hypothetical protein
MGNYVLTSMGEPLLPRRTNGEIGIDPVTGGLFTRRPGALVKVFHVSLGS